MSWQTFADKVVESVMDDLMGAIPEGVLSRDEVASRFKDHSPAFSGMVRSEFELAERSADFDEDEWAGRAAESIRSLLRTSPATIVPRSLGFSNAEWPDIAGR